ncbi:24-hydroxycholesterol 7-alpha-hydroxylase [Heteronotia binoei]|uniref:24-hydroxycholesterol 7-alpha-hydroxylase n=1 Tax=Heteronotia binoei TaxID=13085 RepID=UPI0029304BDE|nr:24-hydroxycholesterol 7-alpha-hydroxylase [Heteronotia binoei]
MDVAVAAALPAAVLLGCLGLQWLVFRSRDGPPCIGGWIPWVGAALRFGQAPLAFIQQARLQYGPVFTVYMLGKRYTFVTEEEGCQVFCTSKDADFEQAVQQSVEHAASIPKEIFYQNRFKIYTMMKGRLSSLNLPLLVGSLCAEVQDHMRDLGAEGTKSLRDLVRNIMFPTTANILFGRDTFVKTKNSIKEIQEHFQNYDEDFEYATQLPEYFLKRWSQSKKWLFDVFRKVVLHAEGTNPPEGDSKTLMQHVLDTLSAKRFGTHYAVLLLWAAQANAVPVSFWTLAFILSHPSVYKNVMQEVDSLLGRAGKEKVEVSNEDLKKLQYIKWCILESVRLRAPGVITKKVTNPIKLQNFVIPAGDMLMLSPYWSHRNPKYFPEPESFKPDRWKVANLEKNAFLEGFVAFGGGSHQCPGRWFAIAEIQILIILFLYKYECSLLDPVPKESPLHLTGTQQPEGPCRIRYKRRA